MALGDLVDPPVYDDSEVWIRRFKNASTRIRIYPAVGRKVKGGRPTDVFGVEAWPSELEHYAKGFGSFPCVQPHGSECGGCNDDDPKIKKRQRFWYFNAIDNRGELHVYKIGVTLRDILFSRESRHPDGAIAQPLSQKDYTIHRLGNDLGTSYDPEAGETYEVEFGEFGDPYNITEILTQSAEKARAFYAGEIDKDGKEITGASAEEKHDYDIPAAKEETRIAPSAKIAPRGGGDRITPSAKKAAASPPAKKAAAPKVSAKLESAQPEESVASSNGHSDWGTGPTDEQIEEADAGEIRTWLTSMEVEFPARAGRALLVKLAKEKAVPPY